MEDAIHAVWAVFILDGEGELIYSQAFRPSMRENPELLKTICRRMWAFHRTGRHTLEAFECSVVYTKARVTVGLVGAMEENLLLLSEFLRTLVIALRYCVSPRLTKRMLLENFTRLVLVLDEFVDDGVVLETEPRRIKDKVLGDARDEEEDLDVSTYVDVKLVPSQKCMKPHIPIEHPDESRD